MNRWVELSGASFKSSYFHSTHRLNQEQTMAKTFKQITDGRGNPPHPITFNQGLTTYSIYTRIQMTVLREKLPPLEHWVRGLKSAIQESTQPIENSYNNGHPFSEQGTFTTPIITGIYDRYGRIVYQDGSEVE